MLNICCINPYAATANIWNHHSSKTQTKHYLHAILFSFVASEIANFVYLVNISGSNHLAPSVPHYKPPLWNVNK